MSVRSKAGLYGSGCGHRPWRPTCFGAVAGVGVACPPQPATMERAAASAATIEALLADVDLALHVVVHRADVRVLPGAREGDRVPLDEGRPERVREDTRVEEVLAVPGLVSTDLQSGRPVRVRPASVRGRRLTGRVRRGCGLHVDVDAPVGGNRTDVVVRRVRVERERMGPGEGPGPPPRN